MTRAAVRFVVSGRVQGVGFRAFVVRAAAARGVTGQVRNHPDGTVEATAHGLRTALEAFVNFEGPALLEVMCEQGEHVYPMIGPGMGYKDMITGKHIRGRKAPTRKVDSTEGGYF